MLWFNWVQFWNQWTKYRMMVLRNQLDNFLCLNTSRKDLCSRLTPMSMVIKVLLLMKVAIISPLPSTVSDPFGVWKIPSETLNRIAGNRPIIVQVTVMANIPDVLGSDWEIENWLFILVGSRKPWGWRDLLCTTNLGKATLSAGWTRLHITSNHHNMTIINPTTFI